MVYKKYFIKYRYYIVFIIAIFTDFLSGIQVKSLTDNNILLNTITCIILPICRLPELLLLVDVELSINDKIKLAIVAGLAWSIGTNLSILYL